MRKVVFSKRALFELKDISDYLELKFSKRVKNKFIDKIESVALLIQKTPHLFPMSDFNKHHKAVITNKFRFFINMTH